MNFEWDENKRLINIKKHGLDFYEISKVFQNPIIRKRTDKKKERRYIIIGYFEHNKNIKPVSVICTLRKNKIRIISFRIARKKEREIYKKIHNIII